MPSGTGFDVGVAQALDQAALRDSTTDSADRGTTAQALLPLDKGSGFSYLSVPLVQLSQGIQTFGIKGYGLIYLQGLSTPGPTLFVNGSFPLYPGCRFDCYFENLGLSLAPGTPAYSAGNVSLLVITRPDADFREPYAGSAAGGSTGGNQLLATIPLTSADLLAGTEYIGADGSRGATLQSVPAFSSQGFRAIEVFYNFQSLTGGTSPTASLAVFQTPDNQQTANQSVLVTPGVAGATGGAIQLYIGNGFPAATSGTAYASIPYLAPYFRVQIGNTGAPTGFAAGVVPSIMVFGLR